MASFKTTLMMGRRICHDDSVHRLWRPVAFFFVFDNRVLHSDKQQLLTSIITIIHMFLSESAIFGAESEFDGIFPTRLFCSIQITILFWQIHHH